jgi:hypothetical protein
MGVVYTAQDTGKMTEARALYEEVAARAASGYMQPTHMSNYGVRRRCSGRRIEVRLAGLWNTRPDGGRGEILAGLCTATRRYQVSRTAGQNGVLTVRKSVPVT